MNWSSFKYLVKQGWHNMVANRLMTVASLGVLTACLVITGIAGILSVSVSNFVQSLGDKDMIEVFISDEATDEQPAAAAACKRGLVHVHFQGAGRGGYEGGNGRICRRFARL